jgi:hypothetical protein
LPLAAKKKFDEKRAEESRMFQREQLLKLLDGEDLTGIDVNTDEGLSRMTYINYIRCPAAQNKE